MIMINNPDIFYVEVTEFIKRLKWLSPC